MKHLVMIFFFLTAFNCYPKDESKQDTSDKRFEAVKGRILKKLDDRIALFNKLRECMDSSNSKKQLKGCSDKYASEAQKQAASYNKKK